MTFGLRCSEPVCRPHPASLPVRVPTVESLPPASFGFPLAVAPCGSATVAVIGSDWLLSSNKILPMLGTPRAGPPGPATQTMTLHPLYPHTVGQVLSLQRIFNRLDHRMTVRKASHQFNHFPPNPPPNSRRPR